jgi:hypothetical protein
LRALKTARIPVLAASASVKTYPHCCAWTRVTPYLAAVS